MNPSREKFVKGLRKLDQHASTMRAIYEELTETEKRADFFQDRLIESQQELFLARSTISRYEEQISSLENMVRNLANKATETIIYID